MQLRLAPRDVDVLRSLMMGATPDVRSNHRLRLELLGLVRDGPTGLKLTAAGRKAVTEMLAKAIEDGRPDESAPEERERDASGRKKGNTRKWTLS
jgi:hypothetical protein